MKTGFQGTFVISWTQTEVDGLQGPSLDVLRVGASWRWSGVAVRVDGPQDVLILNGAEEMTEMRRRAARIVRRLVGAAVTPNRAASSEPEDDLFLADQSFVVTDGRQSYVLTIVPVPDSGARLLMVVGEVPPHDSDLWVVRTALERATSPVGQRQEGGVICFTPSTKIQTESGLRLVETLRPGDKVQTRDNGLQEILWTGNRRMSGARLHAMPGLRPIRFRAGALGIGRPDEDLLVSPQHRMLMRGPAAQALFGTEEVLVSAEDMLNDLTITVDHALREVTYVHLLLPRHNILWANGLQTESFHPSNTSIETIDADQRAGLLEMLPFAAQTPQDYGDYARRNLSASEAAILRHEMAA
jgi:hypothetical protein